MRRSVRASAVILATVVVAGALSGCGAGGFQRPDGRDAFEEMLRESSVVESVVDGKNPTMDGLEEEIAVKLAEGVTPAQLSTFLEKIAKEIEGRFANFDRGVIELSFGTSVNGSAPNTFSFPTDEPPSSGGDVAAAALTWLKMREHFDQYGVTANLAAPENSGIYARVLLSDGSTWADAASAVRTMSELGAFDGGRNFRLRVERAEVLPGDDPGANPVLAFTREAPSEVVLGLVESLGSLEESGNVTFDFSGTVDADDGNSLVVQAVVNDSSADPASVDFETFAATDAWARAVRVTDALGASGINFALGVRQESGAVIAEIDVHACESNSQPYTSFSKELEDYWRENSEACA